jgi:ankyrin repeat protein
MSDELLDFLLANGFDVCDVDAPAEHGLTPLMRAALGGRLDMLDELLTLGAKVDTKNNDGNNALWLGCVSGKAEVVRRLHAARIDLDNQNETGATALMYSASSGKPEMVGLLLEFGANARLTNFDGANAGDMASTVDCLRLLRHTVR